MARTLPKLGEDLVLQIEHAWSQTHPDWIRKRLLVVRLIAQHQHTVAEIMRIAGSATRVSPHIVTFTH